MKSKNDQAEVRYPGIQAKVQEYLRRRWAAQSGSSCRVTTAIVVENVGHNRTTISSAMATLARTPGTGLSDVAAGLYNYTAALDREYVAQLRRDGKDVPPDPGTSVTDPALKVTHPVRPTPKTVIPKIRTTTPVKEEPVIVVTTRTPAPQGLTRDGTPRQRRPMQRDVGLRALRWLQAPENKGDIFSIADVAAGIDALPASVSTVLRHMADNPDWPVKRIMPGTLYTVPLTAAEQAELDRIPAEELPATPPAPVVAPEPPVPPAPAPVVPEPAPQPVVAPEPVSEPVLAAPAEDNMILLEKLAETEPGKWLTRDADGQIYWVEKLR